MKRLVLVSYVLVCSALGLVGCGDDIPSGLVYTDPPGGGALRLVRNSNATANALLLDFVVGDTALTGYSTGFDLPLADHKVTLGNFTPGTALDPGSAPAAARAVIGASGPLAGQLAVGLSQKASGAGAKPDDAELAPRTVLFTIELDIAATPSPGIVFDGTAADFVLPSGGLRSKVGMTVVEPAEVSIGKLELRLPGQ